MNQDKIGKLIKSCRTEQGMTQVQFAEKLGITNKSVSKWETGKCLPDASLFNDICLLLGITLNELFAGEKIPTEDIVKKSEENLISIVTEYQKRDYRISFCVSITLVLTLICIAVNISVGDMWFDGMPVIGNTILTVMCIISWGVFSFFTQKDAALQKVSFVISAIVFISSITAIVLSFYDVDAQICIAVGYPAMSVLYGLTILFRGMILYAFAAVLSLINLLYTKSNIGKLTIQ